MLRVTTIICALTAVSAPALVHAAGGPVVDPPAPVARVVACDSEGTDRAAVFYGRMHALPGSARMAMRFTLVERLGRAGTWDRIEAPGLRTWRRSAPGVAKFSYRQRVEDLRPGGAYRAVVQFRWYSTAGTVLRTMVRHTRACRGELPDLEVGDLDVRPGPAADTRIYRVTVMNTGATAAEHTGVQVQVDRAVLDSVKLAELGPGESRVVSFTGPACERQVRVKVDSGNTVGESDELDNARSFPCHG